MWDKGIAGKMIRCFVAFVLAMGLISMAIFGYHLVVLHRMTVSEEKEQLALLSDRSAQSMQHITEVNLEALNASALDRTNDEFRIAKEDLLTVKSQVEDIFRNPQNYQPKGILPVEKGGSDILKIVVFTSDGSGNIDPATYDLMQRLANLKPTLDELLLCDDYTLDNSICMMDGTTLSFDRFAETKLDAEGNSIPFDAREEPWFTGALKEKSVCFCAGEDSSLYENAEGIYSVPVYVNGEAVAVVKGAFQTTTFSDYMGERMVGESGFAALVTRDGQMFYSSREDGEMKTGEDSLADIRDHVNPTIKAVIDKALDGVSGVEKVTVDGEEFYVAYGMIATCKWAQLIFVSVDEMVEPANELRADMEEYSRIMLTWEQWAFIVSVTFSVTIFFIIAAFSYDIVSEKTKKTTAPITMMMESLNEFKGVNMFFEVEDEYKTGDEIQVLAESFESLAKKMQDYVDEIVDEMATKSRVRTELALATRIQADMLPNIFPAFPERPEFNIFASMTPAKEVGGDFYDFFFVGDDHLALVMADVSGKGVPAAMFMMMAKSLLQNQLIATKDPAQALTKVNNLIFANNKEKMFVTVWAGILDITTGVLTASNGGHEFPIFKEPDGEFTVIKDKHGFVVGGKKNMKYTGYELQMKPGSKLFVYTDGVPEATDKDDHEFGMDRTVAALNIAPEATVETILGNVVTEVKRFVGEAEQFDDLTMLCIEYVGPQDTGLEEGTVQKEITVEGKVENLEAVMAFVDGELNALSCPDTVRRQIDMAVDEIYGNIALYAYEGGAGDITVTMEYPEDGSYVLLRFIDSGFAFNPLDSKDPNLTLKAKERVRGGLGIYLVKKTMDDMSYAYQDGKNVLSIKKSLSEG